MFEFVEGQEDNNQSRRNKRLTAIEKKLAAHEKLPVPVRGL